MVDLLILTAIVTEFSTVARRLGFGRAIGEDYRVNMAGRGRSSDAMSEGMFGRGHRYRTHVVCVGSDLHVAVVQMGLGPKQARQGAKWAIARFDPKRVLVLGLAGGLVDGIALGDVVLAERLVEAREPKEAIECRAEEVDVFRSLVGTAVHEGTVVQSERIVRTMESKRELHDATGAIAVDMESYSVARVCREMGRSLSVVRVISDTVEHELPGEIEALMDASGNPRPMKAVGLIVRRPSLLRELLSMERQSKVAVGRLREIADRIAAGW